ncbi:hypothetical protein B9Z19DRAFT_1065195 [Tuber borchii]|uniref:Uncharacterized protein n=1 Tax=Tuber borchii TaxID=42251 RepID=A0A2T6ZRX7_TUBBO|nr:hypothetical protein B9Z19DRAFT_1065195 [Tuber borchii]
MDQLSHIQPKVPFHGHRGNTENSGRRESQERVRLGDGSMSAHGYFDGLTLNEARQSLFLINEEFKQFLNRSKGPESIHEEENRVERGTSGGSNPPPRIRDEQNNLHRTKILNNESEILDSVINDPHFKQFQKMEEYWSKRNWHRKFLLYNKYEGVLGLGVTLWTRILEWFWLALEKSHMEAMHGMLYRLRTNTKTRNGNLTWNPKTGAPRSQVQQNQLLNFERVL